LTTFNKSTKVEITKDVSF